MALYQLVGVGLYTGCVINEVYDECLLDLHNVFLVLEMLMESNVEISYGCHATLIARFPDQSQVNKHKFDQRSDTTSESQ